MDDVLFVVTRWWAGLIALAALGALLLIAHFVIKSAQNNSNQGPPSERQRGVKALVIGADGRASTSKVQVLLWTLAVLYAFVFLLVWGRSIGCEGSDATTELCRQAAAVGGTFSALLEKPLDTEYYAVLGLPTAAAVAARALTKKKMASGELKKTPADEANKTGVGRGLAEIVSADDGRTDLIDFQYFAFNLVALAYFTIGFVTTPSAGLPELPPTLVALSGVAVAAYTGKKALETDVIPVIARVIPARVSLKAGSAMTVVGSGFGQDPSEAKASVLIDALPVSWTSWSDRRIKVELDKASVDSLRDLDSDTAELTVESEGTASDSYTIELRRPTRGSTP